MAFMALQAVNAGAQYVAGRRAATGVQQQADYEGNILDLNAGLADNAVEGRAHPGSAGREPRRAPIRAGSSARSGPRWVPRGSI
jgi:hypothetical protein